MTMPAWLLLIWSGLGAACAAAIVASTIGGTSTASWSLAPLPRSRAHGAAWSICAGMLAYPILYGVTFELLHRADFRVGLMLGALHASFIFVIAKRRAPTRGALRAAAAHIVYGAVIAFLYVTP